MDHIVMKRKWLQADVDKILQDPNADVCLVVSDQAGVVTQVIAERADDRLVIEALVQAIRLVRWSGEDIAMNEEVGV